MHYWGIVLYGVNESHLGVPKNADPNFDLFKVFEEKYDGNRAVSVKLKNGKTVPLFYEVTEDDNYFGYEAGYPWEFKENHEENITTKDVEDAICQFLVPLGYDETEIRNKINSISTYNCC